MSMKAIVTTGQGGYEQLAWRDVPVPQPGAGEVLLQVLAAGINNTDINTRIGWYGTPADAPVSLARTGEGDPLPPLAGWSGETPFPLIQGADCCGRVVAVAPGQDAALLGRRALVRPCMRSTGFASMDTRWLGSDMDGAFAQFVKVPASEVFVVDSAWSDTELATIPCAYGTAENMLHRAGVGVGDRVLVPGASGGVGSAVVQLALRRGAEVLAITTAHKLAQVQALGAQRVLLREDDPRAVLGDGSVDVVVDNVAGAGFPGLLQVLRRGGRYVSSGAIAGAAVALDLRTMYLKDLTLLGCTAWDAPVFPQLVGYIERQEIRPLVAGVFALQNIADAQRVLLREDDPRAVLGDGSVDVVVDNVAGAGFPGLLQVLRRGGRYVSSGAIAGAAVALDLRTMYLKDLTLIGCTAWDAPVFPQLVGYIERQEVRPLVAGVFALQNIADAQRAFLDKAHVGNFVLVPPQQ